MPPIRSKPILNLYICECYLFVYLQGSINPVKTGVAQALNRLTYASTVSHLRRVNCPTGREGKNPKPRQLHNTHWGMICPAETPEGQQCGLVKNLSLMSYITVGNSETNYILETLEEWTTEKLEEIAPGVISQSIKVFVNGIWFGIHRDARQLVDTLKLLRRQQDISNEVSIVYDTTLGEVRICTDNGRLQRPLFIVEK